MALRVYTLILGTTLNGLVAPSYSATFSTPQTEWEVLRVVGTGTLEVKQSRLSNPVLVSIKSDQSKGNCKVDSLFTFKILSDSKRKGFPIIFSDIERIDEKNYKSTITFGNNQDLLKTIEKECMGV